MLPDRVSNPGPLTYESGDLPIALCGPTPCIRSLHFLRAVSNSFLDSARLHPLHILGWFPYVFALYTLLRFF